MRGLHFPHQNWANGKLPCAVSWQFTMWNFCIYWESPLLKVSLLLVLLQYTSCLLSAGLLNSCLTCVSGHFLSGFTCLGDIGKLFSVLQPSNQATPTVKTTHFRLKSLCLKTCLPFLTLLVPSLSVSLFCWVLALTLVSPLTFTEGGV